MCQLYSYLAVKQNEVSVAVIHLFGCKTVMGVAVIQLFGCKAERSESGSYTSVWL